MLARLERIEGVDWAAVDHAGELLRLALTRREELDAVRAALREFGYDASEETSVRADTRWYGRTSVRELSREEADVIAGRVVTSELARSLGHDAAELRQTVAVALYGAIGTLEVGPTSVRVGADDGIYGAVHAAASPLLGAEGADRLVAALRSDLSSRDRR